MDKKFLDSFENQTLKWEDWNHITHVKMAFLMFKKYGFKAAPNKIISGIKLFNEVHKEKINRGYHETITQFWIKQISDKVDKYSSFDEFYKDNTDMMSFNYIFKYYDSETLFSDKAKTSNIPYSLCTSPK